MDEHATYIVYIVVFALACSNVAVAFMAMLFYTHLQRKTKRRFSPIPSTEDNKCAEPADFAVVDTTAECHSCFL